MTKKILLLAVLALMFSSCDGLFSPQNPQERYNPNEGYDPRHLQQKLNSETRSY